MVNHDSTKTIFCCHDLVAKSYPNYFVTPWAAPARLLSPCDSPGKNTGVGFHFLEEVPGMPPVAAQGGKQGLDREQAQFLTHCFVGLKSCGQIGQLKNTVALPILPKLKRINMISIQIPMRHLCIYRQDKFKTYVESQRK